VKLHQCWTNIHERQQCMKIRFVSFSILLLRGAPQHIFEALFERDERMIPELVDLLKRGETPVAGGQQLPTFLYIAGFRTLHAFVQVRVSLVSSGSSLCETVLVCRCSPLSTMAPSALQAQMRVDVVIAAVEAGVQHGFLPQLLRQCVVALLEPTLPADRPFELVNAVFTLVQLLCHYPSGVDALIASGTVAVLMPLIKDQASARKFSNRRSVVVCAARGCMPGLDGPRALSCMSCRSLPAPVFGPHTAREFWT
jgi:hypothetical protein